MSAQRAPRVSIRVALRVTEPGPGRAMIVECEDVSTTGIFVRCGEPFTVGTSVCVALPIEHEGTIEASGRVVRVGPGASGHVGMGIMFAGLDERSCAAVKKLVSAQLAQIE